MLRPVSMVPHTRCGFSQFAENTLSLVLTPLSTAFAGIGEGHGKLKNILLMQQAGKSLSFCHASSFLCAKVCLFQFFVIVVTDNKPWDGLD